MTHMAYIGLGSNLESPVQQLQQAVDRIASIPQSRLVAVSSYYGSTAVGPGEQPDYVNAAVLLETELDAHTLLDQLQSIEQLQGRMRGPVQWVPRTLDLDLLLYDHEQIQSERLSVPHPRMTERNFVLQPLLDLNPELCMPDGRSLSSLLNQLPQNGLWKL
ncbi:MAG: 2-amino-4-hydroxy-6-hydroxymethyldihydropteridine diphosphokinase [Pseudomonadales bacterium]|nr:2-amino-4-hydroxy-6-hydroxymethyldihydropteridine diphosphokinase [Pseudomonadales bacterium]